MFPKPITTLACIGTLTAASVGCMAQDSNSSPSSDVVRLITLDPGHFHAALVQKTMNERINPTVHVYAPDGPDVKDHLNRINGFNTRAENPTNWNEVLHLGDDYLQNLLEERPGNVVIISGNNRLKSSYIGQCVEAGLNVLSDKPMCIDARGYEEIVQAFNAADTQDVLLYDIMTERSEITTILQRELSQNPDLFGTLETGTPENPAVVKESVHHFFKFVAGNPLKRPGWYFDTSQQGQGIVDVTTHLVDLAMWGCFPEEAIHFDQDIDMLEARVWPTLITREQYQRVTRLSDFPDMLQDQLDANGVLPCNANGEMVFKLRDHHVRISVRWDYQAPEGGGDTHYSIMRGTNANLVIEQGKAQNYRPELYVVPIKGGSLDDLAVPVENAIESLASRYPGLSVERTDNDAFRIVIPDEFRIGHEAHFAQVMERYLEYLEHGRMPDWELPNMLTKYRITTSALEIARSDQ